MSRLAPLPAEAAPDLQDSFKRYQELLGYVPNSVLIMQRRPKMVKALAQLASSVWDPASEVDIGFKRLVAYMTSRTHGCNYPMAPALEREPIEFGKKHLTRHVWRVGKHR